MIINVKKINCWFLLFETCKYIILQTINKLFMNLSQKKRLQKSSLFKLFYSNITLSKILKLIDGIPKIFSLVRSIVPSFNFYNIIFDDICNFIMIFIILLNMWVNPCIWLTFTFLYMVTMSTSWIIGNFWMYWWLLLNIVAHRSSILLIFKHSRSRIIFSLPT